MAVHLNLYSLGYQIPGESVKNVEFNSAETLLDADVLVVDPAAISEELIFNANEVGGKYNLSSHDGSDTLQAKLTHRKTEIARLLEHGKLVIIFLAPKVFINCQQDFSKYTPVSNYSIFPYTVQDLTKSLHGGKGNVVHLSTKGVHPFSTYFRAFKDKLFYKAYFDRINILEILMRGFLPPIRR